MDDGTVVNAPGLMPHFSDAFADFDMVNHVRFG